MITSKPRALVAALTLLVALAIVADAQQPVTITGTVPLPSGAATTAKQPALGIAGAPSADVISVQGVVGGIGIPVTASGTVTANAGTNLNTSALALDKGSTLEQVLQLLVQQGGKPGSAVRLRGSFNRALTSTGDALDVNVKYAAPAYDPCAQGQNKRNAAISQTANAIVVSAAAGRAWVCSMFVVGADAENLSLVEGTGSTCGTGTAAIIGATTAANGPNNAANGGFVLGDGTGSVAITTGANVDLCLYQSASGRVAGNLTYVIR